MKKIITTEAHPEMKAGVELEWTEPYAYFSSGLVVINQTEANSWIDAGWAKEVQEEREIGFVKVFGPLQPPDGMVGKRGVECKKGESTVVFNYTGPAFTESEIRDRLTLQNPVDGVELLEWVADSGYLQYSIDRISELLTEFKKHQNEKV